MKHTSLTPRFTLSVVQHREVGYFQKPNEDYLIHYKLDFFCISVRTIFIVDCFYNADGVLVKAIVTPGPTKIETVSVIVKADP